MKNAIGLAGEIHVFRWLKATYGDAVTPECWISSLRRHVFPGNYDDDYGCDFRFKLPETSVELFLEVKASLDAGDSFELGISETRLAMKLTQQRRKRRLFRIVHVLNAFSASPIPILLPNPYETGSQNHFRIDDTGVRLRYRRRVATSPVQIETLRNRRSWQDARQSPGAERSHVTSMVRLPERHKAPTTTKDGNT